MDDLSSFLEDLVFTKNPFWEKYNMLPEDPNNVCGYGPFSLPAEHPFTRACILHDYEFDLKHKGEVTEGRRSADKMLLKRMLEIANAEDSMRLKFEAYAFYGLARVFGGLFWKHDQ